MGPRVYLDDAAAAPVLAEVHAALRELPEGNPSSPHSEGRAARAALDRARDLAAGALGVDQAEIVFTASGTEAINLALLGSARRLGQGANIVAGAAEHPVVLGALRRLTLEGCRVTLLGVDGQAQCRDQVPEDAGMVSFSTTDNEVGTLRAVPAVPPGAIRHLDACQGPRWLGPELQAADLASFSGFKVGAGRGGLLYVRAGTRLEPLTYGGPQERGRRAGFEDVAAATAVATALSVAAGRRAAEAARVAPLARRLMEVVIRLGGHLTGAAPPHRLPNLVSAVFPGLRSETLVAALDLAGLAVSAGVACASGSLDPSPALLAMGYTLADAQSGLRISLGWETTEAEVERAAAILESVVPRFTKVPA